ncbi:MAG: hypothetical protein QOJ23_340, partial [Actinomycetota bacterium]|nr:hypothetical protein [Actinomycetota bacterium]
AAAFIEGYAYGSLSMTAYGLGTAPPPGAAPAPEPDGHTAPLLPDPHTVPPDETNA